MIAGFQADFVLADKGYDANELIETIQSTGAVAVIPPRKNRIESLRVIFPPLAALCFSKAVDPAGSRRERIA